MLKIGIVGAGGISEAHIKAYRALPELCEIVAIADVVPGKAEHKRVALGCETARAYDDPADLLEQGGVDLVSIATPPASHSLLAQTFLRGGVHVLVEKPMAPSVEECDAMIDAQRGSGKVLSVVAQNRFRDDMASLKAAVDSGLLGRISHVRVDSAWWRGLPYYDLWWRGTWASEGGGSTLNHAIHHIDLLLWLLGRPEEVVAMLTNAQHENAEVEDLSVALFRYGRSLAELTSSVVHHGEEQTIVVQGERARVSQPWRVVADTSRSNGFPQEGGDTALVAELDALVSARPRLAHTGHEGQIADLLEAILDRRPPAIGAMDGRNAVEVVSAIYESGIEHRSVTLPLSTSDPYYAAGFLPTHAPHFFEKTTSLKELDGPIVVGASVGSDGE